jgi:hypothetical protein
MPSSTYKALATITLGSTDSNITFSSIPSTYRDLIIIAQGTVSGSAGLRMRFNNDSANNYTYHGFSGGTQTSAERNISGINTFPMSWMTLASGQIFYYSVNIMDYSATDKHKTVLLRTSENNSALTSAWSMRWASTNVVNEVNLFLASNSFNAGTTFSLYGVNS